MQYAGQNILYHSAHVMLYRGRCGRQVYAGLRLSLEQANGQPPAASSMREQADGGAVSKYGTT